MYGIQIRSGKQWAVVDGCEQTMCVGTMRQCEDWLDFRDNNPRGAVDSRGGICGSEGLWRAVPIGLFWSTAVAVGLCALYL